jgi:hypothetical protein
MAILLGFPQKLALLARLRKKRRGGASRIAFLAVVPGRVELAEALSSAAHGVKFEKFMGLFGKPRP